MLPHFRIPKITRTFRRVLPDQRVEGILDKSKSIEARSSALNLNCPSLHYPVTCVKKVQSALIHYSAAGKTAVPIIVFTGSQSNRQMFPEKKILCPGMTPMHRPPIRAVGMVLIEDMVVTVKKH
jgi:hypothetical protein